MTQRKTQRVWLRLTRGQMAQARKLARWIQERRPALGRPSVPEVLRHCLESTFSTIVTIGRNENE